MAVAVRDDIARTEADPDERRGIKRIGPGFLRGGVADHDFVTVE
jgi:hypothetical protein